MPVIESRLAELRKRRGIAAAELARAAGVSRQTIYAMEAGDYIPNTAVSLKLARILESTVEELFRLAPNAPSAAPAARAKLIGGGDRFPGTPLELCRVGGRLVAVRAVPVPWHLAPVIRREHLELAPVQRLLDTVCQAALRRELETLCAYDTRQTGQRVA